MNMLELHPSGEDDIRQQSVAEDLQQSSLHGRLPLASPEELEAAKLTLQQDLASLTPQQFAEFLGRCAGPSFFAFRHDFLAIAQSGNLDAKGKLDKHQPMFEFEEHHQLGDSLVLPGWTGADKDDKSARVNLLNLPNGLKLSYGTINGLAGDFYGSKKATCSGKNFEEQKSIFRECFDSLAVKPGGAEKAGAILKTLQIETDAVKEAKEKGESVHEVYEKLGTSLLQKLIDASKIGDPKGPSYSDLLENNVDHFAPDSVTAYNAGHAVALDTASKATSVKDLQVAYAINAFADHFLEDHFASGHLRVPRSKMIDTYPKSICTNFMHNEDNDAGLEVSNKKGTAWRCYGDSNLLDPKGKATLQQCLSALRHSVQEVYDAYQSKSAIAPNTYGVWDFAPQDNIEQNDNNAPMFIWMPKLQKIYQRKGLDVGKDDIENWKSYEDVVGTKLSWLIGKDYNDYVYWARLAYNRAPNDYYRGAIRGKLDAWMEEHKFSKAWRDAIMWFLGLSNQRIS